MPDPDQRTPELTNLWLLAVYLQVKGCGDRIHRWRDRPTPTDDPRAVVGGRAMLPLGTPKRDTLAASISCERREEVKTGF